MPTENLEIETLVEIDGEAIDFFGGVGEVRSSQLAALAIASGDPDIRASQLAAVPISFSVPELRLSQYAAVIVLSGDRRYLNLGPVIPLQCWTPCDSYGIDVDWIYWR